MVPWEIGLPALSLAVSGWALFRSLPARVYHRLAEVEDIARTAVSHTNAFKAESIAREAAQQKFLEEAEDLAETTGRRQRRAAASLSRMQAKERGQPPGLDPDAPVGQDQPPSAPLSEDDQKALLAAKHLQ